MLPKLSILSQLVALLAASLVSTSTVGGQGFGSPTYSLADLGTLGGPSSVAAGLNLFGDVVGTSTTAEGEPHAFLYRDGAMLDLGTLPGGTTSAATAITDAGIVVGRSGINAYGQQFREFTQGFVWQEGAMRALGALYCPCSFNERYGTSRALAVNRLGRVVGDSRTRRAALSHAFVWRPNEMMDLGGAIDDASTSVAFGINDLDEIVGDVDGQAFLMRDGRVERLGVLPGRDTSGARAVNRVGQVAGSSATVDGLQRAFLWEGGVMRDLGTLPGDAASEALAISAPGQVVGRSGNADLTRSRAVLWQDGAAIDLNTRIPSSSGWVLTTATAVNDVRQIAGVGLLRGEVRAFLLTPR